MINIYVYSQVPALKDKLEAKEKRLSELTQEYVANRQVLTENLREAIAEAKKQYNAIDGALEVIAPLNSIISQSNKLVFPDIAQYTIRGTTVPDVAAIAA